MKHYRYLFVTVLIASCSSPAGDFSRADFMGVSCSSKDGGKTCFGYGERYENGKEDACGRIPNGGPEFALKLTYEISDSTVCSTVVKTSNANAMPVGDRFCSIYLNRNAAGIAYRFSDDEPGKVRQSYRAKKADKWCQHLIDAL
jgi:hypothetical protein